MTSVCAIIVEVLRRSGDFRRLPFPTVNLTCNKYCGDLRRRRILEGYVLIYTYIYIYIYICIYICIERERETAQNNVKILARETPCGATHDRGRLCMYIYIYIYIHMCIYVYVYAHVYVYVCIYIYICIHMCVYIYIEREM